MSTTYEEIEQAESEVQAAQDGYLRAKGWRYTCDTPGCFWLWTKQIGERFYAVDAKLALRMQRHEDIDNEPNDDLEA